MLSREMRWEGCSHDAPLCIVPCMTETQTSKKQPTRPPGWGGPTLAERLARLVEQGELADEEAAEDLRAHMEDGS